MIIIFLGPAGSGKGTQAKLTAKKCNLPHIDNGELLRQAHENKTPDGLEAEKYWAEGKLSPSFVVFNILKARLDQSDCADGFVLEGYPRVPDQPKLLDDYLANKGQKVSAVICLETKQETALGRIHDRTEEILKRGGEVREDDSEEWKIKTRFAEYERAIKPITDYYEKVSVLKKVDNEGDIEEVRRLVSEVLNI